MEDVVKHFCDWHMLSMFDDIVDIEYNAVYLSFFDHLLAFVGWLTFNVNTILELVYLFTYIYIYLSHIWLQQIEWYLFHMRKRMHTHIEAFPKQCAILDSFIWVSSQFFDLLLKVRILRTFLFYSKALLCSMHIRYTLFRNFACSPFSIVTSKRQLLHTKGHGRLAIV